MRRADACEAALVNQAWNESTVTRAMQALESDFAPISDMRASSDYRLAVAKNLLRRFFLETHGEAEHTVYTFGRTG